MANLTQAQMTTIQTMLDQREQELQAEVLEASASGPEQPAQPGPLGPEVGDAVDAGTANFRSGIEHVEKQRDQEELVAIEHARERIADGSYGDCVDCGKPIPFERLQVQPAATRCTACQSAYEQHHPAVPLYTP